MSLDLVVLVPDKDIEQAIVGLLERDKSIGIRPLPAARCAIIVHPQRDPGVYKTGHELLQPFADDVAHALVVFDRAWDGAPSTNARVLATDVEKRCSRDWGNRARCVCIDPEIENWIWSDSPHVPVALGWSGSRELRAWLNEQKLWPRDTHKPSDPKMAFEKAAKKKKVAPSSSIFGQLARKVGIRRCQDPTFLQLLEILREWFPIQSAPTRAET